MYRFLRRLQRAVRQFFERISDVGAALVQPVERAFQSVGRKVVMATEGAERAEGVFSYLVRGIAWPFRVVWRAGVSFVARVLPTSLQNRMAAPFRAIARRLKRFGRSIVQAADALNPDGAVLWFVWLLQPIWRPIAAVVGFFYAWAATRDYKQALWGLPALVLLLPFVLILTHTFVFGKDRFASTYRLAVKEALEADDYDRVELYERKLAQLGVDTKRSDYMTAVALAKDEKMAEAYDRMQRLAPTDKPGYPSAHFWIIQNLFAKKLDLSPDESQRLIGVHLDHLAALGFEGSDIQLVRAMWLAQQDKLAEAAQVLEPLVSEFPDAAVERMRIHVILREPDNARADARAVRTHMQDRKRRTGHLTSREYESWALAERILDEKRKLKAILEDWHEQDPGSLQVRQSLSDILQTEFDHRVRSGNPDAKMLASLLIDLAELSTDKIDLQTNATALFEMQDPTSRIESVVQQLLQSDRATSDTLEPLGTAAATSGHWDLSERLFVAAIENDPKNAVAWNNRGWAQSHRPAGEQEKALESVEMAIQIQPDEFRFRETRGQILLRLNRWEEAIVDLEFAANGMPDSQEIHEALAAAYDAVGNTELAQIHRERGSQGSE